LTQRFAILSAALNPIDLIFVKFSWCRDLEQKTSRRESIPSLSQRA
jgi:hypothetical protein